MKNKFPTLLILILSVFLFITCSPSSDEDEIIPTVKYNLNITVTPNNSGTVSPSSGSYDKGSSVNLTGTPSTGFVFKEWSGDVSGTTNPMSITMNSNKTITVVFEEKDTDGDGVLDSVDNCPDTPSGQSVDSNGCSTSQKDTDGDSVMDNVDNCPNTPSGEVVDTNGCSITLILIRPIINEVVFYSTTKLEWTTNVFNNTLKFDVYFGTVNPPSELISENQTSKTVTVGLNPPTNSYTYYYWRIVGKDNKGGKITGQVWNFITIGQ